MLVITTVDWGDTAIMLRFGRRRPLESADAATADTTSECECGALLERWRASEQRVWRSWKAWLAADAAGAADAADAADAAESGIYYRLLLGAIAEEEKAAATFELVVRMLRATHSAGA